MVATCGVVTPADPLAAAVNDLGPASDRGQVAGVTGTDVAFAPMLRSVHATSIYGDDPPRCRAARRGYTVISGGAMA